MAERYSAVTGGSGISSDAMPIHLRAKPGDYAPAVLCPGDPRRATYIAETFFDPGGRRSSTRNAACSATPERSRASRSACSRPAWAVRAPASSTRSWSSSAPAGSCASERAARSATGLTMADTVIGISASAVDTTALQYADMDELRAVGDVHARRDRRPAEPGVRRHRARRADHHVADVLRPGHHQRRPLEAGRPPRHRDGGGDALCRGAPSTGSRRSR